MGKIFIDPGHGGTDSGAIGNGLEEKVLNLKVSLFLADLLRKCGLEVILSRTEDIYIGINERASMANQANADICLSVHHNAGGGEGVEVIYSVYGGIGKSLAENIAKEVETAGWHMRRIFTKASVSGRGDYFGIIRETVMPAVITEGGFVDHVNDVKKLSSDQGLKEQAVFLAKAVCTQMGVKYVTEKDYDQHWAKTDIEYAMERGIFARTDKFEPNRALSRAEAATIMARLLRLLGK